MKSSNFFKICVLILLCYLCRDVTSGNANLNLKIKLKVLPKAIHETNKAFYRVGDDLKLSCLAEPVDDDAKFKSFYDLEWIPPFIPNSRDKIEKVSHEKSDRMLNLTVRNLMEVNSGKYQCTLRFNNTVFTQTRHIIVQPRMGSCGSQFYKCANSNCIPKIYTCDGFSDCSDGTDEMRKLCGADPCQGKLQCVNGRCINPQLCCDRYLLPNCTSEVVPDCCLPIIEQIRSINAHHRLLPKSDPRPAGSEFFHSSAYTILGCLVAFVSVLLVVGAAACKAYTKRGGRDRASHAGGRPPALTLHHLDLYFGSEASRSESLSGSLSCTPSTVALTYNVDAEPASVVGSGPPPYSASPVYMSSPIRRDPPPPYSSVENVNNVTNNATENRRTIQRQGSHRFVIDNYIQEHNLLEDNNNNGDINGNSEMEDGNIGAHRHQGLNANRPYVLPDSSRPDASSLFGVGGLPLRDGLFLTRPREPAPSLLAGGPVLHANRSLLRAGSDSSTDSDDSSM